MPEPLYCCGTTPNYNLNMSLYRCEGCSIPKTGMNSVFLTSERITHSFGLDDFSLWENIINPTGKKALQAQLREAALVIQFAEEQEPAVPRYWISIWA